MNKTDAPSIENTTTDAVCVNCEAIVYPGTNGEIGCTNVNCFARDLTALANLVEREPGKVLAYLMDSHNLVGEIICPPCKDQVCGMKMMRGINPYESEALTVLPYTRLNCYLCNKKLA